MAARLLWRNGPTHVTWHGNCAWRVKVKLIPPQCVKPNFKIPKNDVTDAQAIYAGMNRAGMRFVPIKTVEQQDIEAIHRVRSSVVGQPTAQPNGLGPDIPVGPRPWSLPT